MSLAHATRGTQLSQQRSSASSSACVVSRPVSRNVRAFDIGTVQKRRGLICRSEAGDKDTSDLATLPIFPLGVVALPQADVPLQIFEARYRVLFNTLLAGEEGVLEDLVQDDSPFKGSKRFGMCYADNNGLSKYGTVLEIVEHEMLEDGRMLILTKGRERFTVEDIKQERPVLLCGVKVIEEEEDEEKLKPLADDVRDLFKQVLQLNSRYKKIEADEKTMNPPQLDELKPSELSFWLVSMFAEAAAQQQKMLETISAQQRLESIKETLTETCRYLTAALAVESAFSPSTMTEADDEDKSNVKPGDDSQPKSE